MKKFISISLFISACFLGSCSSYDDERIWQDLNEIEKTIGDYEAQTETLTAQMASLSKVLGSSFITLISQDADGNYIISYSDGGSCNRSAFAIFKDFTVDCPVTVGVYPHFGGIAADWDFFPGIISEPVCFIVNGCSPIIQLVIIAEAYT